MMTDILVLYEEVSGVKIDETNRGKNLKAVKTIIEAGYSLEEIQDTMTVLTGLDYLTKWDMLTVQKYIASVKADRSRVSGVKPLQIIAGKFYYSGEELEQDEQAGVIYWDGEKWQPKACKT